METVFLRDEQRFKESNYKRTGIVQQTIYLDCFTMMNATYAKQPFTSKTIAKFLKYFSVTCNVNFPVTSVYPSEWHKFNSCINILKPAIDKMPITNLTSEFSLLQFQVAIYGIYIEGLLNHRWKFTRDNTVEEESVMTSIITFFND